MITRNTAGTALYLDGYNLFYRMYQKHAAKNSNGDPIGGFIGSVNELQRLVAKFMPTEIYYIFDGVDAGRRRRSLYSGYKDKRGKTNRTTAVKLNDELTEFVNNEQQQMQLLFQFLQKLPIKLIAVDSYEADDIIAYLVEQNQDKLNIIASTDKDYLQLVNDNTYVWSSQKKVLITPTELVEKYNIIPQNFVYMRAVVGDTSDKLKGIKGIGEKDLFKYLPNLRTTPYPDFWKFWEDVEKIEDSGKTSAKLKKGKDDALLMYRLMCLKDIQPSLPALTSLNQQIELQKNKGFSKLSFKVYCLKNNIESVLKNYDVWIRPFVTISLINE